jgi:hypothetical protein
MALVADDERMNGLLIGLVLLAAFAAVGALAVCFGTDSRVSDPRDVRPTWH